MSIHSDEPTTTDLLRRTQYAGAFARLAETCSTPMVVGLYGGWGIGKTSLMRQIGSLLDSSRTAIVWFDSWLHQYDDAPALALAQTIAQQLQLGDRGKKILTTVALAFGSSLLKASPLSLWDIKKIGTIYEEENFQVREARVRLREHFQQLIAEATEGGKRRLVVFIDDLDRCTADTTLSLMEALKLYLNLEDCVFFLGVDRFALEHSVQQRYGSSARNEANYLEKIVQLPFTIPPIPIESMDSFVDAHLPPSLAVCKDFLVKGLPSNPRLVKRFINVLSFNNDLAELAGIPAYDPRVLAKLQLIQYADPDLHRRIAEDNSLFYSLANQESTAVPNDELYQKMRSAFVNSDTNDAAPLNRYIYLTQVMSVDDGGQQLGSGANLPSRLGSLVQITSADLLGHDVEISHPEDVREALVGKVVLVTGGAGSIGSELARQIAVLKPKRLILLDKAESPLHFVNLELHSAYPDLDVAPVLADITHPEIVRTVFRFHKPHVVFHTAAYKHVPLAEANAVECARNNVLGTFVVGEAAIEYDVDQFVYISTDKASNPTSIMGRSKRVGERVVTELESFSAARTDFRVVRFGNVLGSDGSIIPIFRRQIAAGQPLTVTHPDVTRYFMTIPEAVQLILQASSGAEIRGKVAVLEMGEPVRIVELAENLIRLTGLEPYKDIPIIFTGLRPGEKLHEEDWAEESDLTLFRGIRILRNQSSVRISVAELESLASAIQRVAEGDVRQLLSEMS